MVDLNLANNSVKVLPNEIGKVKSLRKLNLVGTGLEELPREIKDIQSLRDIYLHGNKFRCDCDTFWMRSWLSNHTKEVMDPYSLICFSGKGKGKRIVELTQDDVGCYEPLTKTKQ